MQYSRYSCSNNTATGGNKTARNRNYFIMVFMDLAKAYNRVQCREVWKCLMKKGT